MGQDELTDEDNDLEREVPKAGTASIRTNVFALYARIFRFMLAKWIPRVDSMEGEEREREIDELILPSNEEWRHQVYYRLVELQRESDAEIIENEMKPEGTSTGPIQQWEWSPGKRDYPLRARSSLREDSALSFSAILGSDGSMTEACIEPGWRINDILLAADVLQRTEPPPSYQDEAEMRRVFGLVYDVLRYKNILNRALDDVGFWYRHGMFKDRERIVWLLLYDMQGRKFARRGEIEVVRERERMFEAAGLKDIEDALLGSKIRLAASVSRLRIGGSALTLDKLLPAHLRSAEGVTWGDEGSIACCWVNTAKVSTKSEIVKELEKLGFKHCTDCKIQELDEDVFVFDPICPKMVNLHEKAREKLAVSDLVRNHQLIFLERSLCLGAAALAQAIRSCRLCGPVVLTHAVAPRHTGYLAELLADIEDAGRLLAFGTGNRRSEYETYLKDVGITLQQCRIFSEKYVSPPSSVELDRATIVLATPPCSYTGVKDIVDLSVARGGDMELLESVTNTDNEIKQPRTLLADQLSTLKYALTRPNVQFLIYEAHTILPSETTEMTQQVVEYANRMAMEKYLREHPPKKRHVPKDASGKGQRSRSAKLNLSQEPSKSQQADQTVGNEEDEDEDAAATASAEIAIPDSDLFEVGTIDSIYGENSTSTLDAGCFLAVIKRKEMMQFDSLFMIKVAESKGLFGDPNKQPVKPEPIIAPVKQTSKDFRKGSKRGKDLSLITIHPAPQSRRRSPNLSGQGSQTSVKKLRGSPRTGQGRMKSRQEQEESVERLGAPTHASIRKMVNRTVPRVVYMPYDVEQSESVENGLGHEAEQSEGPSARTFPNENREDEDAADNRRSSHRDSSILSRGTALSRATQRTFLSSVFEENGKENLDQFAELRRPHRNIRRISRLHHPGRSIGFNRLPFESRLETVVEHTRGFPYVFPGSGGNPDVDVGVEHL